MSIQRFGTKVHTAMVDYAKVVDVKMIKYFRSRKISHREGPALVTLQWGIS